MTAREYEARRLKSERLAGQLVKWCKEYGNPCTDEVAAEVCLRAIPTFTDEHWEQIAEAATLTYVDELQGERVKAVHPPHSQETIDAVSERLRSMLDDPFKLFEVAS